MLSLVIAIHQQQDTDMQSTVQPKRWARYGLADIFGGPKVLDSKIIVYLRNFGEKIIALAKIMLWEMNNWIWQVAEIQG